MSEGDKPSHQERIDRIKELAPLLNLGVTHNTNGVEMYCVAKCQGFHIAATHDLCALAFVLPVLMARKKMWVDIDDHHAVVWINIKDGDEIPITFSYDPTDLYSKRGRRRSPQLPVPIRSERAAASLRLSLSSWTTSSAGWSSSGLTRR